MNLLETMLQLRQNDGWAVPVCSTVATTGEGIRDLIVAIEQHAEFLRQRGASDTRAMAARREEFLSSLKEEIAQRLERNLATGTLASLLAAVENGTLDPDRAVAEALKDQRLLRRGN